MSSLLTDQIMAAGVVGAGGAGFPTQIKAQAQVEWLLVNGAECEPLIHKDVELMTHQAAEVISGLKLMMAATGAQQAVIGIKKKNAGAIAAVRSRLQGNNIRILELGDFYPAGDEYELVQLATGRLIPPGGIPLDVGCVVNNVETLFNVHQAAAGTPVTHKLVSVTGLVREPKTFWAPLGTRYGDLLAFAGGATTDDFAMLVSGVLMGGMSFDPQAVVTKTCSGLIVLPRDHYLIQRMNRSPEQMNRIGKSACDQCTACTEFCPRYLLGYDVQPHKVMRSLGFSASGQNFWNRFATYCCACGLCTLYACPEGLYPREACLQAKESMRGEGISYRQQREPRLHSMKNHRRVPTKSLLRSLRIARFETATPLVDGFAATEDVRIPLRQHVGAASLAVVKSGERVQVGDLLAEIAPNSLGARIHASISGRVAEVTGDYIRLVRDNNVTSGATL